MEEEKEFVFELSRSGQKPTEKITKKESELEEWEINHLASWLLYEFDKLPEKAKQIVIEKWQ